MRKSWVFAGKKNGWVEVSAVEFIDIQESPFGDVMEFQFEGEIFTSNIVFGSRPG